MQVLTARRQGGCKIVEDHRRGKFHDWWTVDAAIYRVGDTRGFQCNESIKEFIKSCGDERRI